jgi:MinD-like ATPase involved in chromosome partitioning or flagellar assembly
MIDPTTTRTDKSGVSEEFLPALSDTTLSNGKTDADDPAAEAGPDVPQPPAPSEARAGRPGSRLDLDELLAPQHVYAQEPSKLWFRLGGWLQTRGQKREDAVDQGLRHTQLRGLSDGITATIASAKGGAGKTAICRGLADLLIERVRVPVAVLEADLDLGTIAESAPAIARGRTLVDVARDADRLSAGGLQGYVTRFPSGVVLVRAPTDVGEIGRVDVPMLQRVLALLQKHYPMVLIDASPGLGIHNPIVAWAYQSATHIVAVAPAKRATVKQLELLLAHLARAYPDTPVTAVLNQVPGRSASVDAILRTARDLAGDEPLHEVPHDPTLEVQFDAANLEVDRLAQPTRIALKHLAMELADGWAR